MSLKPITSRTDLVNLLRGVKDGRVDPMVALAAIEAWADDYCRREIAERQRRAQLGHADGLGYKPAGGLLDGPRVAGFPEIN